MLALWIWAVKNSMNAAWPSVPSSVTAAGSREEGLVLAGRFLVMEALWWQADTVSDRSDSTAPLCHIKLVMSHTMSRWGTLSSVVPLIDLLHRRKPSI